MAQFKSGDLVVLKSGGPTMTVDTVNTDIFDDDRITGLLCAWFVGDIMMRVRFDYRAVRLLSAEEAETPSGGGSGKNGGNGTIARPTVARPLAAAEPIAATLPEAFPAARESTGPAGLAGARKTDAPEDRPKIAAEPNAAAPQPEASIAESRSQTSAEYAAVLDTMVVAMNALIDTTEPTPRPSRRPRVKPTVRVPARKASTTTH